MAPASPAEIPTIKAEGSYKEKPDQPGGIDIPNQDVQVYHEIDGASAGAGKPVVEHMLPPPETPMASAMTPPAPVAPDLNPTPTHVEQLAPKPDEAPKPDPLLETPAPPVATTVTAAKPPAATAVVPPAIVPSLAAQAQVSAPAPSSAAEKPDAKIAKAAAEKPGISNPAQPIAEKGGVMIQLASLPNEAEASATSQRLQTKYQPILASARLHAVRADLGNKGIYYRIQSQPMSEAQAKAICAAVKNQNGACILVRH